MPNGQDDFFPVSFPGEQPAQFILGPLLPPKKGVGEHDNSKPAIYESFVDYDPDVITPTAPVLVIPDPDPSSFEFSYERPHESLVFTGVADKNIVFESHSRTPSRSSWGPYLIELHLRSGSLTCPNCEKTTLLPRLVSPNGGIVTQIRTPFYSPILSREKEGENKDWAHPGPVRDGRKRPSLHEFIQAAS